MIRITRETDYAIVLMSRLAGTTQGAVCRARELARRAGLPYPMASKILKALAREGLLESHRGARGGYSLARGPQEISVAEVIAAMEGPIGMTECSTSPGSCNQEPQCPVSSRWQEISDAVRAFLERIPLSDLLCPTTLPQIRFVTQSAPGGQA